MLQSRRYHYLNGLALVHGPIAIRNLIEAHDVLDFHRAAERLEIQHVAFHDCDARGIRIHEAVGAAQSPSPLGRLLRYE